jgi:putative PIG3 family NAD(P)H quinone oxidoreductase
MTVFLPDYMTVIEITTPGGPEVLVPAKRRLAPPGDGEVLIRVEAAGVNRPDVLQRQGAYPPPKGVTDVPGLEVAGTVVAVGKGAEGVRVGEEVCALVAGGGYANYCLVPAAQCLPVPVGLDMVEAASLPETFFTVWSNVMVRGGLKPDEVLLVHGGASGIGTAAIQIARVMGGRVFVTAGTDEKCRSCEALGAEKAINYRKEDFVAAVKELTGGHGADVILDMVGGDYIPRNIEVLAADGRLVFIAFLRGVKAEVNFLPVMLKRLTVTGSTLRPRPVAEKAAIARALHRNIWPYLESRRITPVIHATFPLEKASEAHRLMESGTHTGKIVLVI